MSFAQPLWLLSLLVVPLALVASRFVQRRRMRYAVRYTNVDLLASVAAGQRPWRRYATGALFLAAVAALCVAVSRPHMTSTVTSDKATVILVLDVSGSMQAIDVKPTRLAAAQKAIHTFLDKVPSRVRVGLVLFAGEAQVATPPTRDHQLVGQAVDAAGEFRGFGGTAIGDAIATAVRLGLQVTGGKNGALASYTTAPATPPRVASTLVSILFLSDGRQTQGQLAPLAGAARAKAAGFPVYTVALGTTGATTLRGFPNGFGGTVGGFGAGPFGPGRRGLSPDPVTLKAIATETGGRFFRARSAGAVDSAYASLGSSLGRQRGTVEITDVFLAAGAALLVLTGVLSSLWSPRLP
ncbi:MAG: Ca-activated chloride channel [Gaiellaceae bacterium]|nr:Ca-activated chloride channel [Gaiellaceae bacterium]MDX6469991.1 Ca-activated chloride channel [Gaiellaceae bacterium]